VVNLSVSPIDKLILELPKSDLHVHLDGSLREESLIEMAQERGVKLPAETPQELRKNVFKQTYDSLDEYLKGFAYTCEILQDPDSLERAAYELCRDSQEEGVRYIEIRFAPQLHTGENQSIQSVLASVSKGIHRAENEFNSRPQIASGHEPAFRAGIITCALRFFSPQQSRTYERMLKAFTDLPEKQIFSLASEALVRASVSARDDSGIPVVGVDLAGREQGYPADDHVKAFQLAHEAFLGKTVHAGEDYGPESIFQAITSCHADRIGHGTWLFNAGKIRDPRIKNREDYVRNLVQYIADKRITIEVCLSSNLQTTPSIKSLSEHPFRNMLDERLSVAFCTDNRLISRTNVSLELQKAVNAFNISPMELGDLLVYGFKRSFFPGPYLKKRKYVRKVIDFRNEVLKRHGLVS
jgi:adenosine deaminase